MGLLSLFVNIRFNISFHLQISVFSALSSLLHMRAKIPLQPCTYVRTHVRRILILILPAQRDMALYKTYIQL